VLTIRGESYRLREKRRSGLLKGSPHRTEKTVRLSVSSPIES
jgi:hypothetical protein